MNQDIWLAIGVCLFVAVMFSLSLLVPRNVRPTRTTDMKLDEAARKFDDFDRRLVVAEHDIKNVRMAVGGLATKDSVNGLSVQVAEMRGEVKGLITNTAATTRSIERIEDFLMKSTAEAIAANKGAETRG